MLSSQYILLTSAIRISKTCWLQSSNLRLKKKQNTWVELSEHLPSHFEIGNFFQLHHAAKIGSDVETSA